ncbi:hypothetical protein [Microbulbifer celer]|uniref:Uncharacterized protein n=1 Tax=Microbulbifer celer TaxID=435905 RepID=A0ABW3UBJ3_9GAMM|nr:hypothetical protein [Microbulbifer celer]UFN56016.1 hypothetical protein LPW13_10550 [Microbulbifer celer]
MPNAQADAQNGTPINTGSQWVQFLGYFLFVLAAWTGFIKYLFPVAFSLFNGEPWNSHVYWDLWPLAHIWLGWALVTQVSYVRPLAIVMSVIEIIIIVGKFAVFLSDPEWTIWRSNWFVNKVFVLGCFMLILLTALLRPGFLHSTTKPA